MKFILCVFFSFSSLLLLAQPAPALAKDYYQKGAFEKALILYEKLLETAPFHTDYTLKLI